MDILDKHAAAYNSMDQPYLAIQDAREMIKRNEFDGRVSMTRLAYGNTH